MPRREPRKTHHSVSREEPRGEASSNLLDPPDPHSLVEGLGGGETAPWGAGEPPVELLTEEQLPEIGSADLAAVAPVAEDLLEELPQAVVHGVFYSEGCCMAAVLGYPTPRPRRACPALILCHGFGCCHHGQLPMAARYLTAAGFITMAFDFRGIGESEGHPRNRVIPEHQCRDLYNAVTFLRRQEGVDPARIGILGIRYGGALAVKAAAVDSRLAVIVTLGSPANLARHLVDTGPGTEDFIQHAVAARESFVLTGEASTIPASLVLSRTLEQIQTFDDQSASSRRGPTPISEFTLESIVDILALRPEDYIARVAPRPYLCVHPADDTEVNVSEAHALHERARQPKALRLLDGLNEHDLMRGAGLARAMAAIVPWLQQELDDLAVMAAPSAQDTGGRG